MEEQAQTAETPTAMDIAFSWFYWIRIALSPVVLATIFALIVFFSIRNIFGAIIAAGIVLAGCIIGYRMAEKARKTIGTVAFAAMTMHNTEFDPSTKAPKQ
jgi:disulfide bond formation protein DsbB